MPGLANGDPTHTLVVKVGPGVRARTFYMYDVYERAPTRQQAEAWLRAKAREAVAHLKSGQLRPFKAEVN